MKKTLKSEQSARRTVEISREPHQCEASFVSWQQLSLHAAQEGGRRSPLTAWTAAHSQHFLVPPGPVKQIIKILLGKSGKYFCRNDLRVPHSFNFSVILHHNWGKKRIPSSFLPLIFLLPNVSASSSSACLVSFWLKNKLNKDFQLRNSFMLLQLWI